jgi:hypothetical protein
VFNTVTMKCPTHRKYMCSQIDANRQNVNYYLTLVEGFICMSTSFGANLWIHERITQAKLSEIETNWVCDALFSIFDEWNW